MNKFMFIVILVMAANMGWFIIPVSIGIWIMVKSFSSAPKEKPADVKQEC